MNYATFTEAQAEARRFLNACRKLKESDDFVKGQAWPITGTKETGALRRASMDLTRALANFRKP